MITRLAPDRFHIYAASGYVDLEMSPADVLARLRANGVWSEEQLADLMQYDVGQSTPEIKAVYR